MDPNQEQSTKLPVKRSLKLTYISSLIISALLAAATLLGILDQNSTYPTEELLQGFLASDVAVLFIGLPILLVSIWLTRRGKLIGLLLWPGALFFVFYNYLIYILAMPFNIAYLMHLLLVMLSGYTLIDLVSNIDGQKVQHQIAGAVPERLSGGVLAGLAILFFLRVIVMMVDALINQTQFSNVELALHAADFIITPAWIICGALLWQRKQFGYVTGLGMLFQASMLFVGLIIALLLQPLITTAAFSPVDVVVVFIMGLICFIPFAIYARAVLNSRDPLSK